MDQWDCVLIIANEMQRSLEAFPLTWIEEFMGAVGNAKWFSTLDLASGFNQVTMDPEKQTSDGVYDSIWSL